MKGKKIPAESPGLNLRKQEALEKFVTSGNLMCVHITSDLFQHNEIFTICIFIFWIWRGETGPELLISRGFPVVVCLPI